ncbi:MAG: phosphate starvation-inducible protein PhoH [Planctomycetes bacterium RIFCSPHIGHO2_02_FULL_50_42]|nr:MAG: phosphate starvation-inducible protein PhoH [Planctomycetes bacterium RIFCSPHIGHO2_02_FULL_50_42]OHB96572.1 MAG: phosphate starvation-inducible protein PhoH [Planctomycetes bacterium RIFCSPLOWO2_02_FULL_50_16]OHC05003.1 MAG: phosphate starvation-inducible protein PhoH [Planctomycetes bacterium RIFCSPLOWO2_12_FULL_50_35]
MRSVNTSEKDKVVQKSIELENIEQASILFGSHDKHLRLIRSALGVQISARNGLLLIEGKESQVEKAVKVFDRLIEIIRGQGMLELSSVEDTIDAVETGRPFASVNVPVEVSIKGVSVRPKTQGQAKYVEAIAANDLVFCIGPAGTGKTYLAVAMALSALKMGVLKRIVLARPAIEAGEKLGYLPGDIQAKVNPFLKPLYDALEDMMAPVQVRKYIETEIIEILPLAFMRGRTLNDAFIILDEAQNCTIRQMKTFLTRMGVRGKVVATGDITQVDLPPGEPSGLIDVQQRLKGVRGVDFIYLTRKDILRHRLVQDIVDAYGSHEETS